MSEYSDQFEQEEKDLRLHIAKMLEHMEWECTLPEREKSERRLVKLLSTLGRAAVLAEETNMPNLLWGQLERIFYRVEQILGPGWQERASKERSEFFGEDEEDADPADWGY